MLTSRYGQVRGGEDGVVLLPDLGTAVVEVLDATHAPVAVGRLNGTSGNVNHVRPRASRGVWCRVLGSSVDTPLAPRP